MQISISQREVVLLILIILACEAIIAPFVLAL